MARSESPRRLSILLYHRVLGAPDLLNTWDPTAEQFDQQMRVLSASFVPMRLADAIDRMQDGTLPARALAVTFDDGYADNVDVALPILRRNQIPATFFVATGYLGGTLMWNDRVVEAIRGCGADGFDSDEPGLGRLPLTTVEERRSAIVRLLAELKHLPPDEREARTKQIEARASATPKRLMMNEKGVRMLRSAGMDIGAHTVTHPILSRLTDAEARREIVDSRETLQSILGEAVPLFAYPNGKPGADYRLEHVRIVAETGFRAAVSTAAGVADAATDIHQLPRFTPWQRDPARFGASLIANRRNVTPAILAREHSVTSA